METITVIALIVGIVIVALAVLFVMAFIIGGMRARSIQRGYVQRVARAVEARGEFDRIARNW